jgi:hypothetical protein
MAIDKEADRARIQHIIALREQASVPIDQQPFWNHLADDPDPVVPAEPVAMTADQAQALTPEQARQELGLNQNSGNFGEERTNPYERARQVRAAQVQAESDPYMAEFLAERDRFVKRNVWGQSGPNDRELRSNRSSYR